MWMDLINMVINKEMFYFLRWVVVTCTYICEISSTFTRMKLEYSLTPYIQFLVVLWQLWAFFSLQLHTPISAFIITWRLPCLCLHMAIFLCKHQSYWIKSPHYSSMTLFNLTMTLFPNKMTLCSTGGCCYSVVMLCLTLCDPTD